MDQVGADLFCIAMQACRQLDLGEMRLPEDVRHVIPLGHGFGYSREGDYRPSLVYCGVSSAG